MSAPGLRRGESMPKSDDAGEARHRKLVEKGELPPGASLTFPDDALRAARIECVDNAALDA